MCWASAGCSYSWKTRFLPLTQTHLSRAGGVTLSNSCSCCLAKMSANHSKILVGHVKPESFISLEWHLSPFNETLIFVMCFYLFTVWRRSLSQNSVASNLKIDRGEERLSLNRKWNNDSSEQNPCILIESPQLVRLRPFSPTPLFNAFSTEVQGDSCSDSREFLRDT